MSEPISDALYDALAGLNSDLIDTDRDEAASELVRLMAAHSQTPATYHDLDSDAAFTARTTAIDAAPDAPESWAATIERVAQAICRSDVDEHGCLPWTTAPEALRDDYRRCAKAALRAVATREGGDRA